MKTIKRNQMLLPRTETIHCSTGPPHRRYSFITRNSQPLFLLTPTLHNSQTAAENLRAIARDSRDCVPSVL